MKKIISFIKKHKVGTIIAVLVLGIVTFVYAKRAARPQDLLATMRAVKGVVVEEVSATGNVEPADGVNLAFESGGKVAKINVKVGRKVKQGAVLVSLRNADLSASLRRANASIASARADLMQYQASLDVEKAKLEQLKRGGTGDEVRIAEASVAKAQQALEDAKKNVDTVKAKTVIDLQQVYDDAPPTLQEVYIDADIAFNQTVDPLFIEGNDYDYLSFLTADSDIKIEIQRQKTTMKKVMTELKTIVQNIPSDHIGRELALSQASSKLSQIYSFFVYLDAAIADNTGLSQTEEATYRGYASTARNSINTAIGSIIAKQKAISTQKTTNVNNIQAAQTSVNVAMNSLEIAKKELILKKAPAGAEELNSQEANIRRAEANIASARARISAAAADSQGALANLEKTILRAPIGGVVTKINTKVGEIALSNTPVVSIISEANFQIEAFIPEADIAKISIGKEADITLDAYGDTVLFKGTISEIDLSETVVEGVPTYKIIMQFLDHDDRIKSGMTANIDITSNRKEDVIVLPQRAIITKDNQRFVIIDKGDGAVEERQVETGIRSIDGMVEIISGVREGEMIVIDAKKTAT